MDNVITIGTADWPCRVVLDLWVCVKFDQTLAQMSWVGVWIILANLGLKQVYKEKKSDELDHSDCHMSQSRVSPKKWVDHNPGTVCCSVAASYRWRTRAAAAPTQSARHVPQLVGTNAGGRPPASERVTTPDDIQHLAVEVEVAGWQS